MTERDNQAPEGGQHEATAENYASYLGLDLVLKAQKCLSDHHDEHLFIVKHQVVELWFKEIIHNINSVAEPLMSPEDLQDQMGIIIGRIDRVNKIFKLLIDQFAILETMTSLDFLEFRGSLGSSSGFQSRQFRELEESIGVPQEDWKHALPRTASPEAEDKKQSTPSVTVTKAADHSGKISLRQAIEKWLERTPNLVEFSVKYKASVQKYLADNKRKAEKIKDAEARRKKLEDCTRQEEEFDRILDERKYAQLVESVKQGPKKAKWETCVREHLAATKSEADNVEDPEARREAIDAWMREQEEFEHAMKFYKQRQRVGYRLPFRALQGAIMILVHRREPRFHQSYQLLTMIQEMDKLFMKWRYHHVQMVQGMIGNRMGTGGTGGVEYLRLTTSDDYKVFWDLGNLAARYIIPNEYILRDEREEPAN